MQKQPDNTSLMQNEESPSLAEKPPQSSNGGLRGLSPDWFWTLVIFVGIFAFFSIFANNFFTVRSVLALLVQTSTFAILSIGAALVLIVGGIDFSIGAVITLSGSAVVVFATMGLPIWASMIIAICLGGIVGP